MNFLKKMKIENIYTSIACNRTPESADWSQNGLILFAGCNSVNLFDPNFNGSAKIIKTYVEHSKRVNTVKWLKRSKNLDENEFISGSDDGTAIFWNIKDINEPVTVKLIGHESGVNVLDGIYLSNKSIVVGTGSADSSIKLWEINNEKNSNCFQTILLKSGFSFAIKMIILPDTIDQILLAFASDDDSISLWTKSSCNKQFYKIHQLSGHENWVRSLDFVHTNTNDLLLASASQDSFIRLWKISPRTSEQVECNEINLLNIPEGDIHVEEKIVSIKTNGEKEIYFAFSLESVLQGHENWVYSVNWCKNELTGDLQLLSSSMDKSLIIWNLTEDTIWMETVRLGGVGGNSLGFFGGKFSPNGLAVLGHGFQGTFHIWEQEKNDEFSWEPKVIIGGHFKEVRDLGWEPKGEFLFSVSGDQTTRIHAPWRRKNSQTTTWHEIARPQVHGYDMQSIAVISRYKFASGAEEKIVRTFQATGNFVENFRCITSVQDDKEGDELLKVLPKGASVPSLGLSNKAVFNDKQENQLERNVKDEYPENYFISMKLNAPPQEENLMQNTLWPEIQKLYGHGYEIYSLAASPNGKLLASACKAATLAHAEIILWNTNTWNIMQKLPSHQLTITQMCFSPNNKYLLSVSRDRRFTLFQNDSNDSCNFVIISTSDKRNGIHARIIWSCSWAHDSSMFATSSRDGKAVLWTRSDSTTNSSLCNWKSKGVLEVPNESITAIAFAQNFLNNKYYLIALGFESGKINLYKFSEEWSLLQTIESSLAHHLAVTKLGFSPNTDKIYLASCADDHFVRINEIIT